jgi:hypothetical protein
MNARKFIIGTALTIGLTSIGSVASATTPVVPCQAQINEAVHYAELVAETPKSSPLYKQYQADLAAAEAALAACQAGT